MTIIASGRKMPIRDHDGLNHMAKFRQTPTLVSTEEWHHRIAEAAYFMAERRSFQGGCPVQDWLEAERQISRQFLPPDPPHRVALVFLERNTPS